MSNTAKQITPTIFGKNTNALVANQGYAYNQAGFTYNQAGWMYGGVYNTNQDVIPTIATAKIITPSITAFGQPYTTHSPINNQKTVGPGWFMFVSQ